MLSFKSKQEQLTNQAVEIIDSIQQRFPFMNYVGMENLMSVPKSTAIGQLVIFRTIPYLSTHLTFFDFN